MIIFKINVILSFLINFLKKLSYGELTRLPRLTGQYLLRKRKKEYTITLPINSLSFRSLSTSRNYGLIFCQSSDKIYTRPQRIN